MQCINATSLSRKSGKWGTQPSLLVKQGSLGPPRGLKNVGCPIQAALWLEWDTQLSRYRFVSTI
jgi:hypothetical protein